MATLQKKLEKLKIKEKMWYESVWQAWPAQKPKTLFLDYKLILNRQSGKKQTPM